MTIPPTFRVGLADLAGAYQHIRLAATSLPRSRWYKDVLILGRLRERGALNAWDDIAFPSPPAQSLGRAQAFAAMQDLFGMPAESILRKDVPHGVWQQLGRPDRVLIDPVTGQLKEALTVVALGDLHHPRPEERDPSKPVRLDDRCFAWNPPDAPCTCSGERIREFNPFNDFGQQQGLACCYPGEELEGLSRSGLEVFLGRPRRECPKWRGPEAICTVNDGSCASKGAGQRGTGGPKVLLFDPDSQPGGRTPNRVVLAPAWLEVLARSASGGAPKLLPRAEALVSVLSWGREAPIAADEPIILARLQHLHDLVGHDVAFAATGS